MSDTEKKKHGFLKFLIVVVIIGVVVFGVVKFVQYRQTVNTVTSESNSDGNTKLLSRSARNSDLNVTMNEDLSALGVKFYVTPQVDISGLSMTVSLLDSNKSTLKSIKKSLGNVKESVQITFTLSISDIGFSTLWNTEYTTWTVTGGTVSYFS